MYLAPTTYFTDVMMISVHTISDSTPNTTSGLGPPIVMLSTVLSVYSGLVPISPKTIPSAARPNAARPDRPTGNVESGVRRDAGFLAHQSIEPALAESHGWLPEKKSSLPPVYIG